MDHRYGMGTASSDIKLWTDEGFTAKGYLAEALHGQSE